MSEDIFIRNVPVKDWELWNFNSNIQSCFIKIITARDFKNTEACFDIISEDLNKSKRRR